VRIAAFCCSGGADHAARLRRPERRVRRCLLTIAFPPQTEAVAQQLYSANEARADLTATAAGSASLSQLAGYEKQLTAANVPVERAVTTIRAQLGLPPASTS
jgi:lauroyl/myristoyl acyltransferase